MKRLLNLVLITAINGALFAMEQSVSDLPKLTVTTVGKDIIVHTAETEIKQPDATAVEQATHRLKEIIGESKPTASKATQTYNAIDYINSKNCNGIRPIVFAVISAHKEPLKYLLKKGASANTKTSEGYTLLHRIAIHSKKELVSDIIKILLEHGANLEDKDNECQRTPLHEACHRGSNEAIRTLIEAGASYDMLDKYGQVALHFAVENTANPEATQTLMEAIEKKYS